MHVSEHYIKPFLENLLQFERKALSGDNYSSADIRRLLQVESSTSNESGTVTLRPSGVEVLPEANRRAWIQLASIVFAYRVADVIGQVNDVQTPHPRKVQRTRFNLDKFPKV